METTFKKFCEFGGGTRLGKTTIHTKNLTKLVKDCKIVGKVLTTADTDIAFSKVMKGGREMDFKQFQDFLSEIAPKYQKEHKLDSIDTAKTAMQKKIEDSGVSLKGTTGTSKTGGVAKMTDTSQYTGAHKERFDESGKGKGIEGREDRDKGTGYVGAYKGEGSYDKKK